MPVKWVRMSHCAQGLVTADVSKQWKIGSTNISCNRKILLHRLEDLCNSDIDITAADLHLLHLILFIVLYILIWANNYPCDVYTCNVKIIIYNAETKDWKKRKYWYEIGISPILAIWKVLWKPLKDRPVFSANIFYINVPELVLFNFLTKRI